VSSRIFKEDAGAEVKEQLRTKEREDRQRMIIMVDQKRSKLEKCRRAEKSRWLPNL